MTVEEWLGKDNQLGKTILEKKYLNKGESLDEWFNRVSGGNEYIKNLIIQKKFLFGGRTLSNRGLNKGSNSNCYSRGFVEDSLDDILLANTQIAKTFKAQGGQGVSLSKIRPKGVPIGSNFDSDGMIPFLEMFNTTTACISQGNSRRGALLASCDVWHKDILDFIKIKSDNNKINNCNLSVEIDDEFMKYVQDYYLYGTEKTVTVKRNYSGHEITYQVTPIKVYKAICEYARKHAEPGILYVDRLRNYNMMEFVDDYQIETTNPCFHPDTKIFTVEGEKRIADIIEPTYVYSMDEHGKLCIKKASAAFKTRENAQTLKITLRCGASIQVTENHKLYVHKKGWIEAKDLNIGDRIVYLLRQRRGRRYSGIKLTSEDKFQMEHRLIYSGVYGPIEDGYDIHHIDGNTFNNNILNLDKIEHSEHARLTALEQNPQNHQIHGEDGRFQRSNSEPAYKKISTPYNISKFKSMFDNAVLTIEEGDLTDVYDICVEDTHCLIANNMVAHNCGEQPLPKHGCCNLCSINLSEYIINPFDNDAYFDFTSLDKDIPFIIDAMDNLIEENQNNHALKEQKEASLKWRNIGLGYMGTADMLAKLSMTYGSDESIEFLSKLTKHIFREALYASVSIAKIKGSFPGYSSKVWDSEFIHNSFTEEEINKLKETDCLRNSTLLSIAPTGSLSSMLNVSGGIEPWFSTSYTRRTVSLNGKDTYYTVHVKTLQEYIDKFGDEDIPETFITAADIPYRQRVKLQGAVQKYIDTAISSTINLPKDTTQEQIEDLYLNAWSVGCKGMTTYTDGSRDAILSTDSTPKPLDPTRKAPKRPKTLEADWYQVIARGQIFNVYVGLYEGKPYEIFAKTTLEKNNVNCGHGKITKQQKGVYSWQNDKEEGVISDSNIAIMEEESPERVATLLASLGLRHGADIKYIVKTLRKTNPVISSFTAAMIRVLNKYNTDADVVTEKCPECGAEISHASGCVSCPNCGWSRCNFHASHKIMKKP